MPLPPDVSSSPAAPSVTHHLAATASVGAIPPFVGYNTQQPTVTVGPPSRYAMAVPTSAYETPSIQYSPPPNLTAEAVAALPPPGKFV